MKTCSACGGRFRSEGDMCCLCRPLRGQKPSPREREVAELASKGYDNKRIACELGISYNTVKVSLFRYYKKTGIKSRIMLVIESYNAVAANRV